MTALHEFAAAPWRVRVWVVLSAVLAVGLSLVLSTWPSPVWRWPDVITALALVARQRG